jgi:hypothetical protein
MIQCPAKGGQHKEMTIFDWQAIMNDPGDDQCWSDMKVWCWYVKEKPCI